VRRCSITVSVTHIHTYTHTHIHTHTNTHTTRSSGHRCCVRRLIVVLSRKEDPLQHRSLQVWVDVHTRGSSQGRERYVLQYGYVCPLVSCGCRQAGCSLLLQCTLCCSVSTGLRVLPAVVAAMHTVLQCQHWASRPSGCCCCNAHSVAVSALGFASFRLFLVTAMHTLLQCQHWALRPSGCSLLLQCTLCCSVSTGLRALPRVRGALKAAEHCSPPLPLRSPVGGAAQPTSDSSLLYCGSGSVCNALGCCPGHRVVVAVVAASALPRRCCCCCRWRKTTPMGGKAVAYSFNTALLLVSSCVDLSSGHHPRSCCCLCRRVCGPLNWAPPTQPLLRWFVS
jgi:hypothetical protein